MIFLGKNYEKLLCFKKAFTKNFSKGEISSRTLSYRCLSSNQPQAMVIAMSAILKQGQ